MPVRYTPASPLADHFYAKSSIIPFLIGLHILVTLENYLNLAFYRFNLSLTFGDPK